MAGAYGTLKRAGAASMTFGSQDRKGPSNKNLGPSRVSKPNPAGEVRSMAGKSIKGPDKGAGGR